MELVQHLILRLFGNEKCQYDVNYQAASIDHNQQGTDNTHNLRRKAEKFSKAATDTGDPSVVS